MNINIPILFDEFKSNCNKLVSYNKKKLIQILQKFGLFRIDRFNSSTGPIAPLRYPTGPSAPSGINSDCMLTQLQYQPTSPTGPISVKDIDKYVQYIQCYVDWSSDTELKNLHMCNYELQNNLMHEKKIISNLNSATNYHSSQILMMRRKIHEYDVLIQKLKNKLVDYKKDMRKEFNKTPKSKKELQDLIQKEITNRLPPNASNTTIDTITEQVTIELTNYYSTQTTFNRYEEFSIGWDTTNQQIDYLTKEKEKFKKLATPEPTPQTLVRTNNSIPEYKLKEKRLEELIRIKQTLINRNADQSSIDDIDAKILEIKNHFSDL